MKDLSIRRQYCRVRLYIIYMMLMSIVLCMCIQPLVVDAYEPFPTHKLGDYIYYYGSLNNLYGYIGTDEDIVIPVINNDPIEIYTLGNNKHIRNVTLNDNVWSINNWAFDGCVNLKNIFVDPDNEYYCSIDGVLFNKEGTTLLIYPPGRKQTEYHIPEGTLDVFKRAFRSATRLFYTRTYLKRMYLPQSVKECIVDIKTLKAIYVDSKNERYMGINGMLIERNTGELAFYPEAKSKRFISPDEVKSIGEKVFYQKGIRYARFNDNLSKIGTYAFFECRLHKVEIPDNVSIIEEDAFDSNRIRTLKLGDSVRIIDRNAFFQNRIRKLNLGSGVEIIGVFAFASNRITSLHLNDSLQWIGGGTFAGNNIRGELIFPDSLEYIGKDAFTSEKISKVVISDGVFIEGSLFGSDEFKKAYDEYGAGTYLRIEEGKWVKE